MEETQETGIDLTPVLPQRTANVAPPESLVPSDIDQAEQQVVQDEAAYEKAKEAILELGHDLDTTVAILTRLWNRGILLVKHPGAQ